MSLDDFKHPVNDVNFRPGRKSPYEDWQEKISYRGYSVRPGTINNPELNHKKTQQVMHPKENLISPFEMADKDRYSDIDYGIILLMQDVWENQRAEIRRQQVQIDELGKKVAALTKIAEDYLRQVA